MIEKFDPNATQALPNETSRFGAISANVTGEIPKVGRTLSSEELTALSALPQSSALLIALSGPNTGARFLLDSDVTNAGRSPRTNIFLDDVTVSRKHAQFLRKGDTFYVKDSGSLNGTYLNRELVDTAELHDGDEIQIGKFRLTFYSSQVNK
ncbi:FHA domain-containing protein [Actinotignum urinale]|uniref:FHA domain-containing protein n=1 Tax=Actinotignum urinale TaxID=190146 RepID=A0AAW9HKV6_9ACTO|nr:FHA domain-containing protein [Actinotignum urinale]MDY5128839.1 FHA domain-containing protein [Actinotignum urinale]MDY5133053.1 FHA domain-containing protein [Actinotignum urinale]MDY5152118.1 FHA domain-containing protein [Actinotignum urinale]MDY5154536.1 FHA domain-containing protein [Actinotignum urinale]MDY5160264.1 FHA domain-containing protein [Actinotignum urinale]